MADHLMARSNARYDRSSSTPPMTVGQPTRRAGATCGCCVGDPRWADRRGLHRSIQRVHKCVIVDP